ncbi:MAG: thioredoxin-disulfide reductase [Syntrophobacterales bacterium]|jgi:thioredoxin reductase (NADPH)|nr:thioredoxin-disulfide reductase [Syntrophobacterales bacterium]
MPAWDYDLVIIGGGPAGLTAGIYAGRARFCAILLEKLIHGGQMMTTDIVENYPGFPEGITGYELSDRMRKQAERFKLLIKTAEVKEIIPGKPLHTVVLEDRRVTTPAIIIATGAKYRTLGVPGEDRLTGHGVSFCATCDGALYRGHEIAMVGGGDNALTEALFLERFAKKIHLIHRRDQFRACKYLQERVLAIGKVQVHMDTVVTECKGQSELEALELRNVKTGEQSTLPVTGAFIAIGMVPNTAWLGNLLPLDKWGFIVTSPAMEVGIPGIFAAGDVRSKWERQISTAVGDGTVAAIAVERYLETLKNG